MAKAIAPGQKTHNQNSQRAQASYPRNASQNALKKD